jgi:hypothetical protein
MNCADDNENGLSQMLYYKTAVSAAQRRARSWETQQMMQPSMHYRHTPTPAGGRDCLRLPDTHNTRSRLTVQSLFSEGHNYHGNYRL